MAKLAFAAMQKFGKDGSLLSLAATGTNGGEPAQGLEFHLAPFCKRPHIARICFQIVGNKGNIAHADLRSKQRTDPASRFLEPVNV